MQYITAAQAAEKWSVTVRRVQDLCRNHQIHGAVRWGRDWMIPADANRPEDRRKKHTDKQVHNIAILPRKNPAIVFSNIYNTPGTADSVADNMTERPVAAQLFRAQIAYCRGELETCRKITEQLLKLSRGHDLQIGCGVILALCAVATGDKALWEKGKEQIRTAHCHDDRDRFAVDFWIAAMECEIRETTSFPLWFTQGRFDVLPGDSYPVARNYYLRYLYLVCHKEATDTEKNIDSQTKMRMIPYVGEPLTAQSHKEGALVSEAYLRLILAMTYHNLGNDPMAIHHLDIAIDLLLPDKLYMVLVEYRRPLDFLLDERLGLKDPEALSQVKKLYRRYQEGWTELHNRVRDKLFVGELTTREREVAKLASFGLSNKEIAERLNISVNTVKQSLRAAMDKTGALRRSELAYYI